jgi:hypothetical protein
MMSARTLRKGGLSPLRTHDDASGLAPRAKDGVCSKSGIVPLGLPAHQQLLLRDLVERFGGEVAASALTRHWSAKLRGAVPASGLNVTNTLKTLQDLGAVDLEPTDDRDVIVRLLPYGADLYY